MTTIDDAFRRLESALVASELLTDPSAIAAAEKEAVANLKIELTMLGITEAAMRRALDHANLEQPNDD